MYFEFKLTCIFCFLFSAITLKDKIIYSNTVFKQVVKHILFFFESCFQTFKINYTKIK